MKRCCATIGVTLLLAFGGAPGCKKKPAKKAAEKPHADQMSAKGAKLVEVTAKGNKYDPPVEIAQIPKGAWFCDMGTVHYARLEKGDGKCPLCQMTLKQSGAAMGTAAHRHHKDHDHMGHMH